MAPAVKKTERKKANSLFLRLKKHDNSTTYYVIVTFSYESDNPDCSWYHTDVVVKLWMSETAVDVADGRKRQNNVIDVNSSDDVCSHCGDCWLFLLFSFVAADLALQRLVWIGVI